MVGGFLLLCYRIEDSLRLNVLGVGARAQTFTLTFWAFIYIHTYVCRKVTQDANPRPNASYAPQKLSDRQILAASLSLL